MSLQTKDFTSSTYSPDFTLTLRVTENSVSTENNSSSISWSLMLTSGAWNFSTYHIGWTVQLAGTTVSYMSQGDSEQRTLGKYSTITIASGTASITHDSDGNLNMLCYAETYMAKASYTPGNMSVSGYMQTTQVPRGSKIGTVNPFNLEDAFSVPITKYSTAFTDKLDIALGSTSIKSIDGYTSGASISLSDAELLKAYNALSANTEPFTFTVSTYNGTALVGTSTATANGTAVGTCRVNANGTWKRGLVWIKENGKWKRAIMQVNKASVWKRGQ